MKKSVIGFCIFFVFSILLINFVLAEDGAYILRDPDRPETGFMEAFDEMNLEIDLIDDEDIGSADFSQYKFIFVGDDKIRNAKYIPVDEHPSVIANGYYGTEFGLLEKGRIFRLAANSPLKIKMGNQIIQIYKESSFRLGGVGIPYYYLPQKYKNEQMQTVATTFIGYKREAGDVVSYSENKCFFGITKSKFWTDEAKNLFKDCVNYVLGAEMVHDVEIVEDYTNSVNGIRIKNLETDEYILDEVAQLECEKQYKIDFKTINAGDFVEDINFVGNVADFEWDAAKTGLEPGKSTTTGSKTITVDFESGIYSLNISAEIVDDVTPENNFKSRDVEVICELTG